MSGPVAGSPDPVGEDVLLARVYLSAVAEPPADALAALVHREGPVRAAELVRRGAGPPQVAEQTRARRERVVVDELLAKADEAGLRLVVPEHDEWPTERFSALHEATELGVASGGAPLALWVRGAAPLATCLRAAVSVVGARAASSYGEQVAGEFGYDLTRAGFTVVSGAAHGIDGAAHRGALGMRGATVAFLACGADVDYPAAHGRLLRAITEHGAVISEYPPGTPPRKHRFLVRNRLIAATGQGVVVVEAGARSGASNTAHTADALGRPVMAVPGPVGSASSVGCHQMIRSGKAVLVTQPDEVIELVSPLGLTGATEIPVAADEWDGAAHQVYEAVGSHAHAEDIATACGLPINRTRALLAALEVTGVITMRDGGWTRRSG